ILEWHGVAILVLIFWPRARAPGHINNDNPGCPRADGLQFAHLRGVLRRGAAAAQPAAALVGEEAQPAYRKLPVLRGVEPAVHPAAVGVDRGRLAGGPPDQPAADR